MSVEVKTGSMDDFFASAKSTAREIDSGQPVTRKNTIWVEAEDLMKLLKPERTALLQLLRKENRIVFSKLMQALQRSPTSLNNDLKLLSRYGLIRIQREVNPGHGYHKVIEAGFGKEKLEFRVEI